MAKKGEGNAAGGGGEKKPRKQREVKKMDWASTPYGVFLGAGAGCKAAFATLPEVSKFVSELSPKKLGGGVFVAQVAKVEVKMSMDLPFGENADEDAAE